jgi:hypothetical protein
VKILKRSSFFEFYSPSPDGGKRRAGKNGNHGASKKAHPETQLYLTIAQPIRRKISTSARRKLPGGYGGPVGSTAKLLLKGESIYHIKPRERIHHVYRSYGKGLMADELRSFLDKKSIVLRYLFRLKG